MNVAKTKFWLPTEVADYFRVSISAVLRWIHDNKIEARVTPSGRYLIPETEVDRIANTPYRSEVITAQDMKRKAEITEQKRLAAIERIKNFSRK